MTQSAFDGDEILTEFLANYIDQTLDSTERDIFEEFLIQNPEEQQFARSAKEGKRILSKFARNIRSREGFEARLVLRIALERETDPEKPEEVRA